MDTKTRLLKAHAGPGTGTRSTGGVGGTTRPGPVDFGGSMKKKGLLTRGRSNSPPPTGPRAKIAAIRAKSTVIERSPSPERLAAAMRSFSVDGLEQPVLPGQFEAPTELKKYRVGETVLLTKDRVGKIKFIGRTHFARGPWYGIELTDKSVGNHDGMVDGRRYFKCSHRRGLFVQLKKIRKRISGKRRLIKMFVKPSGVSPETVEGEWQIWREGEKGSRLHMCDMEVATSPSGDLYGQVRASGSGLGALVSSKKKPLRAEVRGKLPLNSKQKLTFTIMWKPGDGREDIPVGLAKGASPSPKVSPPKKKHFLKRSTSRTAREERVLDAITFTVDEINEMNLIFSGTYKRSKEFLKGNELDEGEFVASKKNTADIKSVFSEI